MRWVPEVDASGMFPPGQQSNCSPTGLSPAHRESATPS